MNFARIKEELDNCKRPIFFFDDDADGLASFLLFYRYKREGRGVVVKAQPVIDEKFLRVLRDFQPDKIFILDIANVEESFLDEVKIPIVWIDHHEPSDIIGPIYLNPRKLNPDVNLPTSYLCYKVVMQDLWIAMTGIVGDWVYIPELYEEFSEKYPDLLSKYVKRPEQALFDTEVGRLAKIFNFMLKGDTKNALQGAKVLTRISDPYEILKQTSPAGRYIWKKYEKVEMSYQSMLKEAMKSDTSEKLIVYRYADDSNSFTGDLSNELLYRNPGKVILIARFKSGEARCSMRSGADIILPPMLEKAFSGIRGRGGGHEHACGVVIDQDDFDQFIINVKDLLRN